MKTLRVHQSRFFAALLAITMTCTLAGAAAIDDTSGDLPHAVSYQLGDAKFAPGDNITIQQMRGTSDTITTGGTYSVEGTYTLSSKGEADLAFYATTVSASGPTPVDPKQHIRIQKGTGSFHLVKTMNEDGFLHVSFYPVPSGSSFGGVYFGQGERVLRNNKFSIRDETGNSSSSEKPVAVNVRAVFVAAQEAARHMGEGGRIITIGSTNAERIPFPGGSVYAMTKAAVAGLTRGLSRDLGPRGITVNTVQPGPIDTDLNPADGPYAATMKSFMALPNYGKGEDVAGMVAYLASPEAGFVTGACLMIDGGFSA